MPRLTRLAPDAVLPLTCTRAGTCCHGKDIRITPWELALLARQRGQTAQVFREASATDAGARLRCDGPPGWRGLPACRQYDPASGCTVHAARPLACRLYPLGRELRGGRVNIVHEGTAFPCLDSCPGVTSLPRMRVDAYLAQQGTGPFEAVRDAYLELSQDCAEGAFVLVFDSGLAASGATGWRDSWQRCLDGGPAAWPAILGPEWHEAVTAPQLEVALDDGPAWVASHAAALQSRAQATFAILRDPTALAAASATMLAAGLLLVHAVGGDAQDVGRRWLARAHVG